jgi:alkylation response protein AidB-like acyl-CoA dehydrogenase
MAPAATHFSVALTYTAGDGAERYAYAVVERSRPGITVNDDWDAMGMRASGSVSVVFENTPLAGRGPGRGAPAGVLSSELLEDMLVSGAAHTAASLGIAEAAHAITVASVQSRRAKGGAPVRATAVQLAADNAIDLAAARAMLGRALAAIDAYHAAHPVKRGTLGEAHDVFAEVQIAKQFINAAAVRIADRALTITGGAGYANTHPLSRMYRDARAGAFMHPLAANAGFEYIGAHALGLSPETF